MKQTHIAHLQQEIVQVFGHPVLSFSDCHRLAEEIFEKTGLKISVNTLRRFFGLIAAKYPPSYNTLTILSKACGFQSYSEFVQLWDSKASPYNDPDPPLLKFMVSLFQHIPVASVQDDTYNHIVRLVITYLRSNPALADAFQKRVARTRNGQCFYFERFVNTDYLASFYGDGLRYYLNQKKETEAQVFGHSLLCFRSWLTMDNHAFDVHYKHIIAYELQPSMPHTTQARHLSARLFHAHIHQLPATAILEEARTAFYQLTYTKESSKALPWFEYILTAALVLTHHFEESLFYIGQVAKKRAKYAMPSEEMLLLKSFDMYQAISLAALGRLSKAEVLYTQLKGMSFYFLDQKFFSILFIHLEQLLKPRKLRKAQLQLLVEETGFKQLEVLFTPADLAQ